MSKQQLKEKFQALRGTGWGDSFRSIQKEIISLLPQISSSEALGMLIDDKDGYHSPPYDIADNLCSREDTTIDMVVQIINSHEIPGIGDCVLNMRLNGVLDNKMASLSYFTKLEAIEKQVELVKGGHDGHALSVLVYSLAIPTKFGGTLKGWFDTTELWDDFEAVTALLYFLKLDLQNTEAK